MELTRLLLWCADFQCAHWPRLLWAQQVAHRRGKHVAVVAMARKLVGILYAMWRDGTTYDPYYEDKRRRSNVSSAA